MLTWTDLRDRFQKFTNTTDTTNLTLGESLMNYAHQKLIKLGNYAFGEFVKNLTTVADQQAYALPPNYGKMKSVTYVDSTTQLPLKEVQSWDEWNRKNTNTAQNGTPTHYMTVKGATGNTGTEIWLWPIPASSSKTIKCIFTKLMPTLGQVDYTTGTISVTAASATVTGSGTTFTAGMVGRSIQLPDNYFYDITGFTSTTVITVAVVYQGSSAAAQTYKIGEVPIVPEAYQDALWQYAVGQYWGRKRQLQDSAYWLGLYKDVELQIKADQKSKSTQQVMSDDDEETRTLNQYPLGPL